MFWERIEHAILPFLYRTGARVREATQLQVDDLRIGRVLIMQVNGRAADDAIFLNRRVLRLQR